MFDRLKKIYEAVKPALIFEFAYRRNHASYVSYSIGALTVCACFLFGQWPNEQEAISNSFGDRFFTVVLIYMAIVATLIATAHASLSIASEKEKKTLTLLRMSGLGPGEIILSKAAVSLCFTAYILLPVAPFLIICPFLGGISFFTIFQGLSILFATTLLFISAGIFISILFKKNYTCISFATAFLLFVHFGFLMIDDIIYYGFESYYSYSRSAAKIFSAFSPLEMWKNFLDSIQMTITFNYRPFSPDYFIRLTYCESAVLYLITAGFTFYLSVKIFENYLKWRED